MIAARTLTVVHMGDSITIGQYIDPARRWTSIVERKLHQAYCLERRVDLVSAQSRRLWRNHTDGPGALPGCNSAGAPRRDDTAVRTQRLQLLADRWRIASRVRERAFAANPVEKMDRAREKMRREIDHHPDKPSNVVTLRRFPAANVTRMPMRVYSEIIREIAAEVGVGALRHSRGVRTVLLTASSTLDMLLLRRSDHLHLSEAGNHVYADAIMPLLESAFSAIPDLRQDLAPAR